MKTNWKTYTFWIGVTEAVGALSGFLSRDGMKLYMQTAAKPPLSPPGWVFPVVWTGLYGLLGFGAARLRLAVPTKESRLGINLYIAQLVINFFWSLIFFNLRAYGLALLWLALLWALVLWMILVFRKTDAFAAKLQIPYLLWLSFAAYLNGGVWYLNR